MRYIEREATPFERFFAGFVDEPRRRGDGCATRRFAQGVARRWSRAACRSGADLRFLDGAMQRQPGAPVKALAYCFCGF